MLYQYNMIDNEIVNQLGRAWVSQKRQEWPVYRKKDWDQFRWRKYFLDGEEGPYLFEFETKFLTIRGQRRQDIGFIMNREENPKNFLGSYKALQPILDKYFGKVILAGGSMVSQFTPSDVDLFFINCSEQERREIINDCAAIIPKYHNGNGSVDETGWSTTLTFPNDNHFMPPYRYQFIARDFRDMGHVLGSFDLFASMVAYDGKEIWATDTGAWAWMNNIIVVDITRISASFGRRVGKYSRRHFDVVLVGLANIKRLKFSSYHDLNNRGKQLAHQLRYQDEVVGVENFKRGDPYEYGNMSIHPDFFYIAAFRKRCYPVLTPEVETLLRMARKVSGNSWSRVPKDVLNLIISLIPYV